MKKIVLTSLALVALTATAASAAEKTSAVYAPKCDQDKVQKIVGDAGKVQKGAFAGGYNISLDESKLTFADLAKKLSSEGCIQ